MLGIYAVAFSLVDRPISAICSSISTVTFPLAVHVLENEGQEAGRLQNAKNGTVLLGLLLPACVGLALTAPLIAAVPVGDQFRVGVARLIPIFCLMALCRGVRAHFVDHAFHLARRPDMMLWTYAPAALASILLNLIAIPRYGPYGAAFVGLVCQAGALAMGWAMGRSVFPIWLPPASLLKSIAADRSPAYPDRVRGRGASCWFLRQTDTPGCASADRPSDRDQQACDEEGAPTQEKPVP